MKRFWWVNHKKTHSQELDGGYMWSPKKESDGKKSQYYDNMRIVRPGDSVISYASTAVRAVGVVTDTAIDAPRPEEFGIGGHNWADRGWLVAVTWQRTEPVRPKDMLELVVPLLPVKYSPLQSTNGNGNQKAYLTQISQPLFELVANAGGVQAATVETEAVETALSFRDELDAAEEQKLSNDLTLSDTEKLQLSMARRGQGQFRRNICLFENACRVTGIFNPSLLIASHIKPWRSCLTALERLDGNNGLLLAPHVDYIFDRGLISFDIGGNLIISPALAFTDLALLGLSTSIPKKFTSNQEEYMDYHRKFIFQH